MSGAPVAFPSGGGGPAPGLVLEDDGVEEGPGGFLLVLVELGEGLELEPELLVGAALLLLDDQTLGGDPEGAAQPADAQVGGLCGAGLVVVDLEEGEVHQLGEGALGGAGIRARTGPAGFGADASGAPKLAAHSPNATFSPPPQDECLMSELVFLVEESPEGGYTARALGVSIVTEADDLPGLRDAVRAAVRCHFDPPSMPKVLRLHVVRDEVIAA